ncbi:hypothetical protein [Streptomyces pristinaespiralis]
MILLVSRLGVIVAAVAADALCAYIGRRRSMLLVGGFNLVAS